MASRHNVGIVLPKRHLLKSDVLNALINDNLYNWFLFSDQTNIQNRVEFWCGRNKQKCLGEEQKEYKRNDQEFRLLTGLDKVDDLRFVFEGKELNEGEKNILFLAKYW